MIETMAIYSCSLPTLDYVMTIFSHLAVLWLNHGICKELDHDKVRNSRQSILVVLVERLHVCD